MTYQIESKQKKFEPFILHVHFDKVDDVAAFIHQYGPNPFKHDKFEDLFRTLTDRLVRNG